MCHLACGRPNAIFRRASCLPAEVYQIKEEIEDRSMTYPAYYTVPFHGGWVGR